MVARRPLQQAIRRKHTALRDIQQSIEELRFLRESIFRWFSAFDSSLNFALFAAVSCCSTRVRGIYPRACLNSFVSSSLAVYLILGGLSFVFAINFGPGSEVVVLV